MNTPSARDFLGRLVVFAAFLFSGCVLASETLTGEQIKEFIGGKEVRWVGKRTVDIKYISNGAMEGAVVGEAWTDEGVWSVEGDKVCRQWNRWLDGTKACFTMKVDGEEFTWANDEGATGGNVGRIKR